MSDDSDSYTCPINVDGLGQLTTTTCWLASYRMLFAWKKADASEIREKLEGVGLVWDQLLLRGINPDEIVRAGGALGMQGRFAQSVRDYDAAMWMDRLKRYGPHYVCIDQGSNLHAVVVAGVDIQMNRLSGYNPYNRFDPGSVETAYWTPVELGKTIYMSAFGVQCWDN